jgi:D-glycero-D-manno-heptose 1,7-bisphosphate phosphatase
VEIENRKSKIENSHPALFLDRDGTLIVDKEYLADPAGVELIPGAAAALQRARALGYRLFLFTNQSGIGRGYYTLEDVHRCNARLEELLALPAPVFDGVCIAPEAPHQPSRYRKPSPNFIREAVAQFQLDPARCWMIGDRESDIDAGLNAGIRVAAVCTGKLDAAAWRARPYPALRIYPDFPAFVASLAPE